MAWQFATDRPIYNQLTEKLSILIINEHYQAGSRLPSVRELAAEAKVNPNTMQKALSELENRGLIYTERTNGKFVTEDKEMLKNIKQQLAKQRIEQFFLDMENLGIKPDLALSLATKEVEQENELAK